MMRVTQQILAKADQLSFRTASALFRYSDDEGGIFFLPEKKVGSLKSPYSGKSFTAKAEKVTMADVKDTSSALYKYQDGDGQTFYLLEKVTGSLKSPYSGKSFKAKADKESLGEVAKEVKESEGATDKTAAEMTTGRMEAAADFIQKGVEHPAIKVLVRGWDKIEAALKSAKDQAAKMESISMGKTQHPKLLEPVEEAISELGKQCGIISKQMKDRILP
jgi:hypothetical protein